jgi:hypothetical protein
VRGLLQDPNTDPEDARALRHIVAKTLLSEAITLVGWEEGRELYLSLREDAQRHRILASWGEEV